METAAPIDTSASKSAKPDEPPAEPELRGSLPRPVRYTWKTRRARRITWSLLPAALCVAYLFLALNLQHVDRLNTHGVQAMARVIGKKITPGHPASYYLDFKFVAKGRQLPVEGFRQVSRERYFHTAVRERIPVTYNPQEPTEYELAVVTDDTVNQARYRDIVAAVLLMIVYGCILLVMEAELAGNRRLLRDGLALVATVAGHRAMQRKSSAYVLYCQYRRPNDSRLCSFEVKVDKAVFTECKYGDRFTVLLLADSGASPLPYFQLRCAEIDGVPCRAVVPYRRNPSAKLPRVIQG